MGDQQTLKPEDMATTSTAVSTVPPQLEEPSQPHEPVAVITLRPTKTEPRKKVVWTDDTVDNEHMNKKKSKCCCIYEKPRRFDESDSEDSDDECEHCFGHVEKKHVHKHGHKHTHTHEHNEPGTSTSTEVQDAPAAEATATVLLRPGEHTAPPEPPEPPAPPEPPVPSLS